MADFEFRIGGRKVPFVELGKNLTSAVKKAADQKIRDRIGSVRCPVHGQVPTIVPDGDGYKIRGVVRS